MSSSVSMRIDSGLAEAARSSGASNSRSAAQQVSHWARIGRELESSGVLSTRAIEEVLDGRSSYDVLGAGDQAVVRAAWREGVAQGVADLDLATEFAAAGRAYTTADKAGNPVAHHPDTHAG